MKYTEIKKYVESLQPKKFYIVRLSQEEEKWLALEKAARTKGRIKDNIIELFERYFIRTDYTWK